MFKPHFKLSLCAGLMLLSTGNLAQAMNVGDLVERAQQKQLAQHPYWRKLLHFPAQTMLSAERSAIVSPEFFLAENGRHDPAAELTATLIAMFKPVGEKPDQHAQCKFIARYEWLKTQLDWSVQELPSVDCHQYKHWAFSQQSNSVSVIFASGYLSNPASLYGHILLKFNANSADMPDELWDESLNFGAIVPPEDGALRYLAKGVWGGYTAAFKGDKFYRHTQIYAENELRDLWEYELALTPTEVRQLSTHVWELMGQQFTYYFFNQNCATEMADVLQLVIEQPLLPEHLPWSIPVDVFNRLMQIERNGQALVKQIRHFPSRLSRFHQQYKNINTQYKQIVTNIVTHGFDFSRAEYNQLSETEKIPLVDALLEYITFRRIDEPENLQLIVWQRTLLLERSALPGTQFSIADERNLMQAPHFGPRPDMLRIGLLHNQQFGSGSEIRWRPAYFDALSLDAGRVPHATLSMFDLRFKYLQQQLTLNSLDLVKIENFNLAHSPLPQDGGLAWRVKFGWESANLSCLNCATAQLLGGIGKAVALSDKLITYAVLDGSTQAPYQNSGTLALSPMFGMIASPMPAWKSHFALGSRRFLNGNQSSIPLIIFDNRFGLNRDWDIRLNYQWQQGEEWLLATSLYW